MVTPIITFSFFRAPAISTEAIEAIGARIRLSPTTSAQIPTAVHTSMHPRFPMFLRRAPWGLHGCSIHQPARGQRMLGAKMVGTLEGLVT